MAVDSIIARLTKSVRVIVFEASGCCASAFRACAAARPSASAGPIEPMAMVRPAVMIEIVAIIVAGSMVSLLLAMFGGVRHLAQDRSCVGRGLRMQCRPSPERQ